MNPVAETFLDRLRHRVLTALHTGQLKPGERLPSARIVAEELGVDRRAVMDGYRALQEEGLVEVRRRSGVYLVGNGSPSPDVPGETARWMATRVVTGAWRRRIPLLDLPDFVRACVHSTELICACVDEIDDDRLALCKEIGDDFGVAVREIAPLPENRARVGGKDQSLAAALAGSDLVIVTAYHETEVRPVARELDIPVVTARLNPEGTEELRRHKRERGRLTFVVLDERARRRVRAAYGRDVELITAERFAGDGAEEREGALVVTPAAAEALEQLPKGAIVPKTPLISPETAEELAQWIVQLNLQSVGGDIPRRRA